MFSRQFSGVWILLFCNALAFAPTPLIMLLGSLIGVQLAPSAEWATLPIAVMVIGAAIGILPATQAMQRFGRKPVFLTYIMVGVGSCLLAYVALSISSFTLFCLSTMFLGFTNSAIQQLRFAAMESVAPEQGPTAASMVMCGGIIAAFLGPELALQGRHWFAVEYQGSFVAAAGCFILAGGLLGLFRDAKPSSTTVERVARPLWALFQNPAFCLALASGAIGFVVMTFVMTGTPISMHHHHGHSLADTKWVIQSHIAAMFLPSLITPWLFRRFSLKLMMLIGLGCYTAMIVAGLFDTSVMGFWTQLVLLGVGWNFLFVSGTALLPSTYLEGEQFRAQGINDVSVFSFQAIASLSAGWAINVSSWQTLLLVCLVPMAVLVVALLAAWRRA
jgi:MFS family permease